MLPRRNGRASLLSRLERLEELAASLHVQPILIEHTNGRVSGTGTQEWPSLAAALAELEGKQCKPPLVIQLQVDELVVAPEDGI